MVRTDAARAISADAAQATASRDVDSALAERRPHLQVVSNQDPLTILIVVPTLDEGAADAAVVDDTRVLVAAGHRPIVVSRGGRLEGELTALGAGFIRLNVATRNPIAMLRNAWVLARLMRTRHCDLVHAHARGPAWSAYLAGRATGVPLVTTWHKGFREQNILKRLYNSVMVRGARVIAANDQLAELINERHGTPLSRIAVLRGNVDLARFDPTSVSEDRIAKARDAWGVKPGTKVILVVGRMLRRKGHHVVVQAVRRLKDRGLKDFVCVFLGEDGGRTHYVGELWDLVLSTGTSDVIRLGGAVDDLPAAYAAATIVVSASLQPEGLQRAILQAQAMARPVVASNLAADAETVLAPPAIPDDRMTGLRVAPGDEAELAAALIRLFSLSEMTRRAIGARGRAWVLQMFDPETAGAKLIALYGEVAKTRSKTGSEDHGRR